MAAAQTPSRSYAHAASTTTPAGSSSVAMSSRMATTPSTAAASSPVSIAATSAAAGHHSGRQQRPSSVILLAALQASQELKAGSSVYLMDPAYLNNWFAWALHQTVPPHEVTAMHTAVRAAAVRHGLVPPTLITPSTSSSHGKKKPSYSHPGPMDNTALSIPGHWLVLSPLVQVLKNASNSASGAPSQLSSEFSLPPVAKQPSSTRRNKGMGDHSERLSQSNHVSTLVSPKSKNLMGNHSERTVPRGTHDNRRSLSQSSDTGATLGANQQQQQQAQVIPAVAVPEAFYETLRSIHGVVCEDGESVSFQRYIGDSERILLHHQRHHQQQHGNQIPPESNNNTTSRPVEFRRKIIHALHHEPEPSSLLEKLMWQEQHVQHRMMVPVVEVHPIKLLYTTVHGDESTDRRHQQQQHHANGTHHHSAAATHLSNGSTNNTNHNVVLAPAGAGGAAEDGTMASSSKDYYEEEMASISTKATTTTATSQQRQATFAPHGFCLVSRETPAVDALLALMRVAAPNKASQSVRLWSQQVYRQPHAKNSGVRRTTASNSSSGQSVATATTASSTMNRRQDRATAAGDDYELADLISLTEPKKTVGTAAASGGESPQQRLLTVQEWVDRHCCTSTSSTANNGGGSGNSLVREYQVLVETRRTVNSPWPRQDMELEHHIQVGDFVDAQDVAGKWYEAFVQAVDDETVTLHYAGWASRWNATIRRRRRDNENEKPASSPSSETSSVVNSKLQPPAPLWSQTGRWREQLSVGDTCEIRDSSSIAQRPKWYKGVIRKIGHPNDTVRELVGGADVEKYPPLDGNGPPEKLLILGRTQQVLVEVEQERTEKAGSLPPSAPSTVSTASPLTSPAAAAKAAAAKRAFVANEKDTDELKPEPPYLRWVDLYGEEICRINTHLKEGDSIRPVTLRYEYDRKKPVEIMKTFHTPGFVRESLRGTPPAPGSVGLQNLGNSCYLNATIQCLNHIEPLTQFFLKDTYVQDLNRRNPLGSGGNVACAYASLLKKMWGGDYSILAPRVLKQTVANFAPQFDNSYQHDSQEFCQFLMDGIHEDLNRVKTKPYVEELEGFGMKDEKTAIESWRKHLLRHDSVVVDHCQGMHRSHLTCPHCGRESIKFDVYSSISLPLVTFKDQTTIDLRDCLEKFMEGEQLDERNAWYCPSCRKHVCALKMIALWSVPDILILHLKRFTFDTCMISGGMLRAKVDTKVEFPIEGLDLSKLVLGPIDKDAPPIYQLFGVSEHTGPTANSGHYTATVRNSIDGQWYRCNDSHVGQTSGEASVTGGAYVLFFQRSKGLSKWGGMHKLMEERGIDPYGGLETDQEGFTKVKTKKKTKGKT